MDRYEAIDQYIRQARIERSVYVADLLSTAIVASMNGMRQAAEVLLSSARARSPKGIFTFDA